MVDFSALDPDPDPGSVRAARARQAASWGCALCVLLALSMLLTGARRLWLIERGEIETRSELTSLRKLRDAPTATRLSARLAEVKLQRDQRAVFELCAQGALGAEPFPGAFEVLILHAEAERLMLRVPLDADHLQHVRGSQGYSCLMLGSGMIEHTGSYRIEAVWPRQAPPDAVLDIPLSVSVQASPSLTRSDFADVAMLGAALLLGILLTLVNVPGAQTGDPGPQDARWLPRDAAPALALALLYVAMQWPSQGGLATLGKGGLLLALQLGLPFAMLVRSPSHDRTRTLGLHRLARPGLALSLAAVAVPLLVATARFSLRVVPSTEVAPIETFIAWPSGMLSAALLGALLPVGEELFFRGYVLGAWLPHGKAVAATASIVTFGLMHAEQSWGNWGGLLSIVLTGAVLTGLRLVTGSPLLSALSHVAYNLTLSLSSLGAALDS